MDVSRKKDHEPRDQKAIDRGDSTGLGAIDSTRRIVTLVEYGAVEAAGRARAAGAVGARQPGEP